MNRTPNRVRILIVICALAVYHADSLAMASKHHKTGKKKKEKKETTLRQLIDGDGEKVGLTTKERRELPEKVQTTAPCICITHQLHFTDPWRAGAHA